MQVEFLPLDCSFDDRQNDTRTPNSIAALWYRISFPLVAIVSYMLILTALKLKSRKRKRSKYEASVLPSMRLVLFVVYLALCIDLVSNLLTVMSCHDLASEIWEGHPYAEFEDLDLVSVWMEDTSVTCWRGVHLISTIFSVAGLSMCLLAIVYMVLALHGGCKTNRLKDPDFVRRFGFLYLVYRTEGIAVYWESVITVRKVILAAVEVYAQARETSSIHVGLLALVMFVSLALQDIFQPFRDEDGQNFPSYAGSEVRFVIPRKWQHHWSNFNQAVTMNALEKVALFVSLSLFLVAGCITDENAGNTEATVLLGMCFLLNVLFFVFMIYRLWYGLHHYVDLVADNKNITFVSVGAVTGNREDRETYMMIKLWMLAKCQWKETVQAGSIAGSV